MELDSLPPRERKERVAYEETVRILAGQAYEKQYGGIPMQSKLPTHLNKANRAGQGFNKTDRLHE